MRVAHSKSSRNGTAREKIEELISGTDPQEWSVARDLAIQKNIPDMIVLLDMARELDVPPTDLEVTEGRPYDDSFEVVHGNESYVVVPDEATAYNIALERVKEDLENSPSSFSSSFIEAHIDQKELKKYVFDARLDDDYVEELAERQPDDFWRLAARFGVGAPDPDEDGEMPEPSARTIREVKRGYAEDEAENPMSFFENMYGAEEAVQQAVDAVGIDVEAAAEDAVDTDKWQRFLAHYDGNAYTTDSGLVYWRTN